MSNDPKKSGSVGRSPVTGEPADVHAPRKPSSPKPEPPADPVERAVERGKQIVKGVGDNVRRHAGPPGTP